MLSVFEMQNTPNTHLAELNDSNKQLSQKRWPHFVWTGFRMASRQIGHLCCGSNSSSKTKSKSPTVGVWFSSKASISSSMAMIKAIMNRRSCWREGSWYLYDLLFFISWRNIGRWLVSVCTRIAMHAGISFALVIGRVPFDQKGKKWNRNFPEIRFENFDSPQGCLFSGNLEIPEISCSIWPFYPVWIGPSSCSSEKLQDGGESLRLVFTSDGVGVGGVVGVLRELMT